MLYIVCSLMIGRENSIDPDSFSGAGYKVTHEF